MGGQQTLAACDRYRLTNEELLAWQKSIEQHGMRRLHTTRT
jgi:hypothetical protein